MALMALMALTALVALVAQTRPMYVTATGELAPTSLIASPRKPARGRWCHLGTSLGAAKHVVEVWPHGKPDELSALKSILLYECEPLTVQVTNHCIASSVLCPSA